MCWKVAIASAVACLRELYAEIAKEIANWQGLQCLFLFHKRCNHSVYHDSSAHSMKGNAYPIPNKNTLLEEPDIWRRLVLVHLLILVGGLLFLLLPLSVFSSGNLCKMKVWVWFEKTLITNLLKDAAAIPYICIGVTLACPVLSMWFSRSISSNVVARAMAALIVRTLGWKANDEI